MRIEAKTLGAALAAALLLSGEPACSSAASDMEAAGARPAVEVPGTGWTVRPPAGFLEDPAEGRLRWRRDVLAPRSGAQEEGGTQFEYITAMPDKLPNGLVPFCTKRAQERWLEGLDEKTHLGRRLVTYLCPGTDWSSTDGDSHTWRCLLDIDGKTGVEVAYWSTWLKVKEAGRVSRDRSAGLDAFRGVCDSLAPAAAKPPAAKAPRPAWSPFPDCDPDGFEARIESVDLPARSLTVVRRAPGSAYWSVVSFAPTLVVRRGLEGALAADLKAGDWVHVQRDCLTGMATGITILVDPEAQRVPALRPESR